MPSQSLIGSGLLQPLPHPCGGHHQFQLYGSCSVWVWYPCPAEACIVQKLLVASWSSYTWPSSVPFCHMLSIGSPLQGRKLILGHAVLCSSHRSVVVSAAVVEVCCPLHWPFCWDPLWMVWMVLKLPSPKASILLLMALWVLHTSNILAVVSLMGRASSFFTNSLSSREWTSLYCMFHSFSSSVGKLQWSAQGLQVINQAHRVSHQAGYGSLQACRFYSELKCHGSIIDCKCSRNALVLFFCASAFTPVGCQWLYLHLPWLPRKFKM